MITEHEIQIRVRYHECDSMGLLHHSRYLTYFEMGRLEMFRAGGGDYPEMERLGLFFVVAKAEINYKRPVRYDDLLTLRTRLVVTTAVKMEHEYHLLRDGQLLTIGKVTLALVDKDGQLCRIPEEMQLPREPEAK